MKRKILTLTVLSSLLLAIVGCTTLRSAVPEQLSKLTARATTTQPVCQTHPSVTLSSSASSIKVGEMLTLSPQVTDVGMPSFSLTLTSGAKVTYSAGTPQKTDDNIFEIVSVASGKFVLRGKTVGSANAIVNADGEEGCFYTGYYWGNVDSAPIRIEVTP